jgi:hypothetical protein
MPKLLSESNPKIAKSVDFGYLTTSLMLLPSNESGLLNVCTSASPGCKAGCLVFGGRGRMNNVKRARMRRTKEFHEDKYTFHLRVKEEITGFARRCKRRKLKPAVRLNCFSDIMWEKHKVNGKNLMQEFPDVQFYDYTKHKVRMMKSLTDPNWDKNYHLTFSRSETNDPDILPILRAGGTVAYVEKDEADFWRAPLWYKIMSQAPVNGDQHDLTFLHPPSSIIRLNAKGVAKHDTSGFVLR